MSSSNTSADLIASVNNVSNIILRYIPIFIYAFGLVGNCLNVLVLGQRNLRSTPSAIFFLFSSIAGCIVIVSGLTSRMMSGYSVDLTLTVGWICKIRNVVLYSARTLVLLMIVLATIDRWLLSSVNVHFRHMSNMKNVQRSICIAFIYTCVINAPIIFCYQANLTDTIRGCYGSTYACRLTTDLIYAFGSTLLPLFLMVVFGLLTVKNVRQVRRRVQVMDGTTTSQDNRITSPNVTEQQRLRKRDRSLLRMLFVQVSFLILLTCPHAIQKVYSSFAASPPPQSLEYAIQTLIFNFFTLFTFTASGMPFYIYTLTGGIIFRDALFDLIKPGILKKFCH
ncbi:unnamed protein product [Adineta steineri]|uniref:G-protein coupled receptors family 1 profile domain-containing protein n=1 Tax=Adineta steineri TaxID=433720 RepID=A0A819VAW6_9BILA|nr:unnamed protein product [Adineta steineri]CAF4106372.1 unnamed protein product [Adineta steineri]